MLSLCSAVRNRCKETPQVRSFLLILLVFVTDYVKCNTMERPAMVLKVGFLLKHHPVVWPFLEQ